MPDCLCHRYRHLHQERRCNGDKEFGSPEELLATVTSRQSFSPLFTLPTWAVRFMRGHKKPITKAEDRMRFVVELAANNVKEGTGGPFGAAIFERRSIKLIAIGVNLVESAHCSHAHAEMVAI